LDSRLVLPVNAIVDGYRILRVVGSGGFGITYEAEDLNLGLMVAVKEYYPFDFGDRDSTMSVRPKSARHKHTFEWGRSNFLQEARTLARFEHPSIVRVTRVFEAHATAYMVMRFEKGLSLEEWLRDLGRRPTQEELDAILHPLLDALELMHEANFLHRDIAPDNIIIRPDGTPVLLDFGAARRSSSETELVPKAASRPLTGVVKAGYSPHEQYSSDGRMQGPWSDLYALGGTLYRAVAGKAPEEATLRFDEDLMASATELGQGKYRPDFLEAIDACLKVRHSERPRSVAQLRPMLLGRRSRPNIIELAGSSTPSLPRILEAAMPQERRRWAAVAAVAVLVAGVVGGLAYKSTIAVARQSPEINVAEKTEDRREAQRRKDIADAAETDALRQAEADATAERKREDELRTAALDEARQRDERRKEDERVRLATIPSGEEQTAFVKRVQETLKRNQCHDGNVTGRADEAQDSVDRFVENAKRSGRVQAPRIKLAKASVGDFESWLSDVEKARWEPCLREAPKVEKARPIVSRQVPTRAPASYTRQPSAPRYAGSSGGSSGPGLIMGIGH
jgi:serine/threonine protein kinase